MRVFSIPVMRWLIVVAAFLVWVNTYTSVFKTQTISLPVVVENLPEQLAVANSDLMVTAKLSGRLFDLRRMSPDSLKFVIRLSDDMTVGEYDVDVVLVNNNSAVAVTDYQPKSLKLRIENRVEKTVPILITPTGSPADNFSVKAVTSESANATISGASSLLDAISEVVGEVVINRRSKSFTEPAVLYVEVSNIKLDTVKVIPETAKVSVEIAPGAAFRNLGLRAAFAGELPGGFWIQEVKFSPPTMIVQGTSSDLASLLYLTTTPIDLSNRTKTFTERVAVDLPNGIDTPEENIVSAEIIIASGENTRQFSIIPQFVNVTEGFVVTSVSPGSLSVVVSGDPAKIVGLTRTDIKLNIDMSGSLSGGNTVKITDSMFDLPDGIGLASFAPDTVEVVLTRQGE